MSKDYKYILKNKETDDVFGILSDPVSTQGAIVVVAEKLNSKGDPSLDLGWMDIHKLDNFVRLSDNSFESTGPR